MRGWRLGLAVALLVALAGPGSAAGADDTLRPLDCVSDTDSETDCEERVDVLDLPHGLTLSPDGTSLYVGTVEKAIASFERRARGRLDWRGCIEDAELGAGVCDRSAERLGPTPSAISPDGSFVYSLAFYGLSIFARDEASSLLEDGGCITDENSPGAEACGQTAEALYLTTDLELSPNGRFAYAASRDDAITTFARDLQTGELTPLGCVEDDDTGEVGCAQSTDGLNNPRRIAISPDGQNLYTVAGPEDAIAIFDLDPESGALTPAGCIDGSEQFFGRVTSISKRGTSSQGPDDCAASTDGMNEAANVEISPDGAFVYVVSQEDSAIVRFARDPSDGSLSARGCQSTSSDAKGCGDLYDGVDWPADLAIAPNGRSAFAIGASADSVSRFRRNPENGRLRFQTCADDQTSEVLCPGYAPGLDGAYQVVLGPRGSLYVNGLEADAIVRFRR